MEYQVPQFIEVEDKIFGPFTFKQAIYLGGGIGLGAIVFFTLPLFLAVLIMVPVGALTFALAFYRINNKPFVEIMEAAFTFYLGNRLYLWKKEKAPKEETAPLPVAPQADVQKLGLSQSKLRELALSLDIQDRETREEDR